ncbi:MAG TPA: proton-conducting transporter membrane subunit [Prolixibacteraceae bacterium]
MSLVICILCITAFFVLLVGFLKEMWSANFALVAVLINAGISSYMAFNAVTGQSYQEIISGGSIFGDIPIRIDALSGWFILMMNFTVLTGILYGRRYMKLYENKSGAIQLHFIGFIINHFSMIGIFCVQNSLAFLYVWEVMALSSFILIIFEYKKPETLKAGINYLIQSHICILFITVGLIWVSSRTNSYDFNAIGQYSASVSPALSSLLFLIFFIGFAIKAGFVPFHTWLPYAHPVAPSHVSGVMSGVMIKLGIFGILRMLLLVNQNYLSIGYFILIVSLISGVYGVILAIVQHDLKKLLAYHSIENIGIIGMGIGLGAIGIGIQNPYLAFAGFAGALLHTLNHSLFKSLLFYGAGTIYQAIHTLNIDSMGGLIKKMPQTAILFLIAAMAISGLPPFNGFVSEFLIYQGFFEGIHLGSILLTTVLIISIVALVLIGGLALLCFTKAFGIIFLGQERKEFDHEVHEAETSKLLPGYLVVLFILIIGLFPQMFVKLLINPVRLFTGSLDVASPILMMTDSLQSISLVAWSFLLAIAGIAVIKLFVSQNRQTVVSPTWGCGYVAPNSRMQYTASSYVRTYRKLIGPLLLMNKREVAIEGVFSSPIHSETHPYDKVEATFIDVPLKFLYAILARVRFLQTGNVRHYILYGVLFIFIIVTFSLLNVAWVYLVDLLKQI